MTPRFLLVAILLVSVSVDLIAAQEEEILEKRVDGEVEYADAEKVDAEFDVSVLNEEGRPDEKPIQEEVEAGYYKYLETSRVEVTEKAERVELYYEYLTKPNWYQPYYPCCPRSQNYDCRSVQHRLPCFSHWVNGFWQYCCPFWPTTYIANCNCGKCVKQCASPKCFAVGNCYRRYSQKKFWAVCYNKGWAEFRYFTQWLPTSCYCGASC